MYFNDNSMTANFEARLYENDPNKRFDFIFGTVQPGSDQLFVSGVQGAAGAFTQDFCDANPPGPGSRSLHVPGWRRDTHTHAFGNTHSDTNRSAVSNAVSDAKCNSYRYADSDCNRHGNPHDYA